MQIEYIILSCWVGWWRVDERGEGGEKHEKLCYLQFNVWPFSDRVFSFPW